LLKGFVSGRVAGAALVDDAGFGITLREVEESLGAGRSSILGRAAESETAINISPTVSELRGIGPIKGFQVHHILPEYLGKMLGYTPKDMMLHPGAFVSRWAHTGAPNPAAIHKAIARYLPPMVKHKKAIYTAPQIGVGLQRAYGDLGFDDYYSAIEHLIR